MYIKIDSDSGGWKTVYECSEFCFSFEAADPGDELHLEIVKPNDRKSLKLTDDARIYIMNDEGRTIDSIYFRPRRKQSEPESIDT